MGKREFLSWLFLGLFAAAPVFLPTSPALAQDCTDPDGAEGSFGYHADYGVFMGCAATGWVAWHPATRDPTCAGTPKMFVTPCDVGMVWNGISCMGSRLTLPWNDEGSGWVDVPGVPNCSSAGSDSCLAVGGDGRAFTTAVNGIVATDANSFNAGHQYHRAATYCHCLGKELEGHCAHNPKGGAESFGHSDWYLPSLAELNVIFTNRSYIKNFMTVSGWPSYARYWSSSEFGNTASFAKQFTGGAVSGFSKTTKYPVRCARR